MTGFSNILVASGIMASVCATAVPAQTAGAPRNDALNLYVVGAPMKSVLEQIMVSFGADSRISPSIDQVVSSYRIEGSLDDILLDLESSFDLVYFKFNDVVYVSRVEDIETKILRIEGATPQAAVAALQSSGLPTDRFAVGTVMGSNAVVVTAPEEFIEIAEALLLAMEPTEVGGETGIVVRRGVSISRELSN